MPGLLALAAAGGLLTVSAQTGERVSDLNASAGPGQVALTCSDSVAVDVAAAASAASELNFHLS